MRGWVKARRTTTTWGGFMSKRKLSKCLHENVWDISTAKKNKKINKVIYFLKTFFTLSFVYFISDYVYLNLSKFCKETISFGLKASTQFNPIN